MHSTLERSGGESLDVVVSKTGLPTEGGVKTNMENARIYNNKLINYVKNRTSKRLGKEIKTYIFAMYDKNVKRTPPDVEKFWGLFHPNKQSKYDIHFG